MAMIAEDHFVPPHTRHLPNTEETEGFDVVENSRITNYYGSKEPTSLVNWGKLGAASYGMGGSLGASLSRTYGVDFLKKLSQGVSTADALDDIDTVIKELGGFGWKDELARAGISVFATDLSGGINKYGQANSIDYSEVDVPFGFGFPAKKDFGLKAIDVSKYNFRYSHPSHGETITYFPPTSHYFRKDFLTNIYKQTSPTAFKSDTYTRKGVRIPAGCSLMVVVK